MIGGGFNAGPRPNAWSGAGSEASAKSNASSGVGSDASAGSTAILAGAVAGSM